MLTEKLKAWLVKNADVKADATDAEFEKACRQSLSNGKLSSDKYVDLTITKSDEQASELVTMLKTASNNVAELRKALLAPNKEEDMDDYDEEEEEYKRRRRKRRKREDEDEEFMEEEKMEDEDEVMKGQHEDDEELSDAEKRRKRRRKQDEEEEEEEMKSKSTGNNRIKGISNSRSRKPSMLERLIVQNSYPSEDGNKSFSMRVKEAAEQYDNTKSALTFADRTAKGAKHPFAGKPMMDYNDVSVGGGKQMYESSDMEKAVSGAYGQFLVSYIRNKSRRIAFETLPQHSKELLCYAMEKMDWGGASDGGNYADIKGRRLTPSEQKALIDDSASGGIEAAPIVFDDDVIQTPLLYGELFPLVKLVPLDRGRRIEGVSTGTVTGGWGGVDDTAISLFNTASYVSAFDTTIFRWQGSVRIGLDFLSDTPIDFGQHLTSQYGERLLEDLDDVIATGNGSTQPEGVMNKSGTTSVAFGGSTSLGNYESLRFGVAKPEHKANLRATAVFCGTETSYSRAIGLPVDSSDARRLGGAPATVGGTESYDEYHWMQRPYKINESLSNQQIFYAIMGRYRMYRRRGLTMVQSTEGDTLIRNNEMLLVALARYGGQLERGGCAAVTSTAPA